jgi:putative phosphoesterase
VKYIEEADEVWHAGDIGSLQVCEGIQKTKILKAVYGNVDGVDVRSNYSENLLFMVENIRVLITHIGGYPGKYTSRAKQLIEKENPKLFICGHSHILKVMYDKKHELLYINPGAAGVHGFHKVRTAVKFEIDGSEVKNLAVIELGERTLGV